MKQNPNYRFLGWITASLGGFISRTHIRKILSYPTLILSQSYQLESCLISLMLMAPEDFHTCGKLSSSTRVWIGNVFIIQGGCLVRKVIQCAG